MFPSSFTMKLRKHIKQKRLTGLNQIGIDRIIDLKFGDQQQSSHIVCCLIYIQFVYNRFIDEYLFAIICIGLHYFV